MFFFWFFLEKNPTPYRKTTSVPKDLKQNFVNVNIFTKNSTINAKELISS